MKFNRQYLLNVLMIVLMVVAFSLLHTDRPAQAATTPPMCQPPAALPITAPTLKAVMDETKAELHQEGKTPIVTKSEGDTPVVIHDNGAHIPSTNGSVVTHTNQGNHYGNNQPDQNKHDDKKKHNGENTAAEHHNEVKGKTKSK